MTQSLLQCGSLNDVTSGFIMTIYFRKFLKDKIQYNQIQQRILRADCGQEN